jgi:hypothetical protein
MVDQNGSVKMEVENVIISKIYLTLGKKFYAFICKNKNLANEAIRCTAFSYKIGSRQI